MKKLKLNEREEILNIDPTIFSNGNDSDQDDESISESLINISNNN